VSFLLLATGTSPSDRYDETGNGGCFAGRPTHHTTGHAGQGKNYDTVTFMNALRVRQLPQITQYMTPWLCRQSTMPVRVEETFG
jgi:hypothetical protein